MNGSAAPLDSAASPPREWGYLEATVLMTGLTLGFMALQMARPTPFGTMGVRGASALIFYPLIMALAVGAFPWWDPTRSLSSLDPLPHKPPSDSAPTNHPIGASLMSEPNTESARYPQSHKKNNLPMIIAALLGLLAILFIGRHALC